MALRDLLSAAQRLLDPRAASGSQDLDDDLLSHDDVLPDVDEDQGDPNVVPEHLR